MIFHIDKIFQTGWKIMQKKQDSFSRIKEFSPSSMSDAWMDEFDSCTSMLLFLNGFAYCSFEIGGVGAQQA